MNDPRTQLQKALQLHKSGQHQQARKIYEQLLPQAPNDPQINHFLGLLHQQLGDHATAIPYLQKAADTAPQHAQAQAVLAASFMQTGQTRQAIGYLKRAVKANPRYAAAQNSLGMAQRELGELSAAISSYKRALEIQADNAVIHNNLGNALADSGLLNEAVVAYQRAIELQADYPDALNNLGLAWHKLEQAEAAQTPLRRAVELQPDFHAARLNLALSLALSGDVNASIDEYLRVIAAQPDNAQAHNFLGNAYNTMGDQSRALAHYRQAIVLEPELSEAHFHLAMITRHENDAMIAPLEQLVQKDSTEVEEKIQLGFAIGKAHEDLQHWDRSFHHYQQANQLKNLTAHVSIEQTRHYFERLKSVFSRELLDKYRREAGASQDLGQDVIFIVGMPRSGTSLTEQILASHSGVTGAGELKYLGQVSREIAEQLQGDYPESLSGLLPEAVPGFAESYLSRIRTLGGPDTRICDKMPQNFHHLGLIALLFPQARIVHCRRHAMATCFSLYKTLFTQGQSYSYDLTNLGQYYRLYEDLMEHWRCLLGEMLFEVEYEQLTQDPAMEVPRLLDYCGLDFESACLQPEKTRRAVATASAAQVRRPINRDSVDKWKNYETFLSPLKEALESNS